MALFVLVLRIICYILAVVFLALAIINFLFAEDGTWAAKRHLTSAVALAILGSAPYIISLFRDCMEFCFS